MNNGPLISSRVGRLMACTFPQKCPLLSPRSRYHRPPGQGSIFSGMGIPSGVSFPGPICSSNEANVVSRFARTSISLVMFNVRLSIPAAVEIIFPSLLGFLLLRVRELALGFGALLHPVQLMLPEPFEGFRPLVKRPDSFSIGAIKHVSPVAPHVHQADIP